MHDDDVRIGQLTGNAGLAESAYQIPDLDAGPG